MICDVVIIAADELAAAGASVIGGGLAIRTGELIPLVINGIVLLLLVRSGGDCSPLPANKPPPDGDCDRNASNA